MKRIILLFIMGLMVPALVPAQETDITSDLYKQAKQAVYTRDWDRAITLLEDLEKKDPGGRFGAESLYWLAYSRYKLTGDTPEKNRRIMLLEKALADLDTLAEKYRAGDWIDDGKILKVKVSLELVKNGRPGYRSYIEAAAQISEEAEKDIKLIALAALAQLDRAMDSKNNPFPLILPRGEKPEIEKEVKPEYPRVALQARVQGTVLLKVTIDTEGRVIDINIFKGHSLLNSTAIKAVKESKYKPYIKDGKAVPVTFIENVDFIFTRLQCPEAN